MKIELDKSQLDEVAVKQIKGLEKEVRSLRNKLARRDKEIANLKGGMDMTKERREAIKDIAQDLVEHLQDAEWADYNELC